MGHESKFPPSQPAATETWPASPEYSRNFTSRN
jgi:hypothetical protein